MKGKYKNDFLKIFLQSIDEVQLLSKSTNYYLPEELGNQTDFGIVKVHHRSEFYDQFECHEVKNPQPVTVEEMFENNMKRSLNLSK